MGDRKGYVAPVIAWEDVLEQTSLACNATQPFPINATCFAGEPQRLNYAPGLGCANDVSKGGAFALDDGGGCDISVNLPGGVVVLS
ncbi:MAG: hypothetical protein JSV81_05875 [Anaerolineales bacterium]|nr:MAG: hypothetical protein JSV81_05875 [Anaerolineales bacterium]